MFSVFSFFLTLVAFNTLLFVNAGLYIVNPRRGSVCQGGKPCTIDWLDDGQSPLLSAIGVTTVGLYTGNQHLVQTIVPVDVSKVHSLTFTPLPEAGPNSDAYYISFISTTLKQNNSRPYAAFSPFFQLKQMTGSFDEPNPIATSSIAVPSSVVNDAKSSQGNDVLTTITINALPTTSASTSATISVTRSAGSSASSSAASSSHSTSSTSEGATTNTRSSSSVTAIPTSSASGFSTLVVPTASSSASSSASGTSTSTSATSSSSASASPSSSSKTNGASAVGPGSSKMTGFGVAFVLFYLLLLL